VKYIKFDASHIKRLLGSLRISIVGNWSPLGQPVDATRPVNQVDLSGFILAKGCNIETGLEKQCVLPSAICIAQ
jgi:hypothetical protein